MISKEIKGKEWGMILLGKNKDVPVYKTKTDGKWSSVKTDEVPEEVKTAFINFMPANVVEETVQEVMPEGVEVKVDKKIEIEEVNKTVGLNEFGLKNEEPEGANLDEEVERLEKESIHNCTLKDIAQELYDRFGIYTCYLQREPNREDIHPVTGNLMTNFTLGQTRTQYLSAKRMGTCWNGEVMKKILTVREQSNFNFEAHRQEHPERFDTPMVEKPGSTYAQEGLTMKEWREMRAKEKPLMNSEHGRRGDGTDEDELYAEPPINGRTIIRPYATNPIAQKRLAEKKRLRDEGRA